MSGYAEIILSPDQLKSKDVVKTTITMEKSHQVLLRGTIFNSRQEAIEGAVVRVIKITWENQKVNKGYVITNGSGEFAIAVEKDMYADYQLDIYEPLITT